MFKSKNATKQHKNPGSLHVVFGATCSKSMDWKSIAVFHSFYTSGWTDPNKFTNININTKTKTKPKITRLMACTKEQLKTYRGMDIGPTFVFTDQQSVKGYEDSPTYNKPAGIMHFTQEVDIEEEYILFIDADMLLRRVIDLQNENGDFHSYAKIVQKGVVMTEHVWYIQEGIKNGLAKQFLTDEAAIKRASHTHGGYYHLFHVDDARAVAPRWLHYTREVRHHPEKYWSKLPGSKLKSDINTVQKGISYGEVPWISEMYGYAFAAAEVGLDHKFTRGGGGVLYGDDFLSLNHDGPILSHYTLSCHIPSIEHFKRKSKRRDSNSNDENENEDFYFDKNEFPDFDPLDCNDGFLFPRPDTTLVDEGSGLCAENVIRINNALCNFYKNNCSSRTRAYKNAISNCPWDTNAPFNLHHSSVKPSDCGNQHNKICERDVKDGVCFKDPSYMQLNCLEACGFCAITQPHGNHGQLSHDNCKDLAGSKACSKLANEMECVLNPTYMVVNCRKTCGKCPNDNMQISKSKASTSSTAVGEGGKSSANELVDLISSQDKIALFYVGVLAIGLLFVLKIVLGGRLSPRGQMKKAT